MSINRFVFSLGDGIDSFTMAHKGRGIINFKDKIDHVEKEEKKSEAITTHIKPRNQIDSGDTLYDVCIINDYEDLYQALDLNSSLTTSINPSTCISSETSLFKKAKLTKQSVSLLIKGRKIGFVEIMPTDATINSTHEKTLKDRPNSFVVSFGDEHITQVVYGKIIYALLNFSNSSKEDLLEIKQSVEANLTTKLKSAAKLNVNSSLAKKISHSMTNISIEFSGVDLVLPSITSSIEGMYEFIDKFNKAEIIGSPIGYMSEPYATIMPCREAAELSQQMTLVKAILVEYDKSYNKLRFLIPSLESLVAGARFFKPTNPVYVKKYQELIATLDLANQQKRLIQDFMLEISLNKSDLTLLPEKIAGIPITFPPPIEEKKEDSDPDLYSSLVHKRQYFIFNQLNEIIKKCSLTIANIESTMDTRSRQFVAELNSVSSADDHFHLNLPPNGALIRFKITPSRSEKNNEIRANCFTLRSKNPNTWFSRYKTIKKNITDGMEIKLSNPPSDRLKIYPHDNENFVVTVNVVGLEALDTNLPRTSTMWSNQIAGVKNRVNDNESSKSDSDVDEGPSLDAKKEHKTASF